MRVLIACEESQEVCKAFRARGHEAFSCDIMPCSGGHPEWHMQMDCFDAFYNHGPWDKVISFPPCTDLAASGAAWFKSKREDGRQEASIRFFVEVWKISDYCENPIGIMNGGRYIHKWFPQLHKELIEYGFTFKPSVIIQPWQFGHGETKATCIWRRTPGPDLIHTNIVAGREQRLHRLPPSPDRAKLRSKTFPGIAKAMAEQWG